MKKEQKIILIKRLYRKRGVPVFIVDDTEIEVMDEYRKILNRKRNETK